MLQSTLKAINKSIRIPRDLQPVVGREIVRLTLNPVIYRRSQDIVRWTRHGTGQISPQSVLIRAARCYPRLSLSNAVEAVLLDLLLETQVARTSFSKDEQIELDRFQKLPVFEKIQITQKRNRLARYLRSLPFAEPAK